MTAGTPPEVAIPISRSKVGFLAIGSLAMAVAAGWMLLSAPGTNAFHRFVLGSGVVFFLLAAGVQFRLLLRNEPGLVANRQGFLFRPTGVAFGWVDWADVSGVREGGSRGGAILSILVRDPQKYIARGNWLQRLAKAINCRLIGTPVSFTTGSLQANPAEVVLIIQRFLSEAEQAESQPLSSSPPPM